MRYTFFWLIYICIQTSYADLKVTQVTVEGRVNPLGMNTLSPSFGWRLGSAQENVVQRAYRIRVRADRAFGQKSGDCWDSGWINSAESLFRPYGGKGLGPGTTYYLQVEVEDNRRRKAKSEIAFFHTGLLSDRDWGDAQWIAKEELPDSLVNPLPLSSSKLRIDKNYELPVFRKSFPVAKKIVSSYAYISGLGHYELYLNGHKVDDSFLQPGWTKYDKEAYYVVYDITEQLQQVNTVGVMLGNGFYYIPPIKGRYQKHKVAFGLPKLKMKIVTRYEDGTTDEVVSDSSWKVHRSPITFSSIYGGEDYDANVLPANWMHPSYNDATWDQAILVEGPRLVAQQIAPTKVMETFLPVQVDSLAHRKSMVYDFGQNASAVVTLQMRGHVGDTVRVYPGELLNDDGSVSQKWTGSPHYYEYIFGAEGEVNWSPRFAYYGFRYAEVFTKPKRNDREVTVLKIQSDHVRNSTPATSTFHTSDTLFNQIHELIGWGIKSNMVSLFTDCPHREKLGWLEQLHLMGPSIQYNFDAQHLFLKALADMRHSQTADGLVPEIAPEYVQFDWGGDMFRDSPEWGSSSIILPWYGYQWYGNPAFLSDNYRMMKRYIGYLEAKAKDNILYQGLSDWYDIGPERPGVSQLTPAGITGTAIYYYDLGILSNIAGLLGHPEDKAYYDSLRNEVYLSFNRVFYDQKEQYYGTGSQTAQSMALYMGLATDEKGEAAWNHLLKDIFSRDTSFTAGDIGHRYLIQTLFANQRDDVIYAMHKDDTRPGYGYQIRQGATALTESWAALPTVSNNHMMLGHLMEWFYSGLAGIRQDDNSVAFKHLVIEPRLLDQVPVCDVQFETSYGEVRFSRDKVVGKSRYTAIVPANSTCKIILPSGRYRVNGELVGGLDRGEQLGDKVEIALGSGQYRIEEVQ